MSKVNRSNAYQYLFWEQSYSLEYWRLINTLSPTAANYIKLLAQGYSQQEVGMICNELTEELY